MNVVRVEVHGTEEQRKAFYESLLYKDVKEILQKLDENDYLFSLSAAGYDWDCYGFHTPKGFAQIVFRAGKAEGRNTVIVGGLRLTHMTQEQWKSYLEDPATWAH